LKPKAAPGKQKQESYGKQNLRRFLLIENGRNIAS